MGKFRLTKIIIITLLLSTCGCNLQQGSKKATIRNREENIQEEASSTSDIIPKIQTIPVPERTPESEVRLPEIDPLDVEGDLSIAGSSTVFPLSRAIYERFIEYGYAGKVKLDRVGSGAGFRLFCKGGKTDISAASRPIKAREVRSCAKINRQPIEFRIGTDALAVVVNPENTFVSNITREELAAIFTSEKWSDVNPDWPNDKIKRFLPGEDSGTFDFFVEEVLNNNKRRLLRAPNTEFSEDDDYIEQSVASNTNGIGFLGYSYYKMHADALRILSIEGIKPSAQTVDSGDYMLARPLFIYSDANIIRNKPQVGEFINFYLSNVNQIIEEIGYFPSSPETLDESKTKLLEVYEN